MYNILQQEYQKENKNYNYNFYLEGLRGLAAIVVGLSHVFGIKNILDPGYHPQLYWLNVGQSTVLIFFIMSGYVIGLTNKVNYSDNNAKNYLIRRLIRLTPIYIIAIILGLIAIPKWNVSEILGNLLFLQNILVPPLLGNTPVWSINYEIVYYIMFLIIWRFNLSIKFLLILSLMLSTIAWFNHSFPQILGMYASGSFFWLAGLWLSFAMKCEMPEYKGIPLISYIFLFYASHLFNFGYVILHALGFQRVPINYGVFLSDIITIFPICLVCMATVVNRRFFGLQLLKYLSFLIPSLMTIYLLFTQRFLEERWLPAVLLTCLSLILVKVDIPLNILSSFSFLGRISYAFYLVHFPILLLIHNYFPYSGSPFSFYLRFSIWLVVTVVISILLELVMQPSIKKRLNQQLILSRN